jgi:hypothetical protein
MLLMNLNHLVAEDLDGIQAMVLGSVVNRTIPKYADLYLSSPVGCIYISHKSKSFSALIF